jgi:sec-independent protein translocase protein TatA
MGLSGINLTHLLVILGIVLVVFGTKRLKSLGSDLGGAIKGFRNAMDADDKRKDHVNDNERQRRIQSDKDAAPDAEFSGQTDNAKHG